MIVLKKNLSFVEAGKKFFFKNTIKATFHLTVTNATWLPFYCTLRQLEYKEFYKFVESGLIILNFSYLASGINYDLMNYFHR